VLHPGVDTTRFAPPGVDASRRGLLVAGRIMWQKQIELAIDAYRIVVDRPRPDGMPHEELTIAGAVDVKSTPYLAALRERAVGLPVRFVVDPGDDDLVALMQSARALVFTAPNEDFGMVVLEALACGTPVLAGTSGGPAEIIHPTTGWLVTHDVATFAARMTVLLTEVVPAPMRQAAVARAHDFGWDAFTRRVDDVLEQAAAPTTSR
jgi:alpha-1,6-mannosyltransferase